MRRAVAILLGLVLASASSQAFARHVHAYTDHDHAEHHHGPAVHEHHHADRQGDDRQLHIEACDAGQHAVSLVFGCAENSVASIGAIDRSSFTELSPPIAIHLTREVTDVRVHGPPPHRQASPRAPPLVTCP